jgi:hypothetical protein
MFRQRRDAIVTDTADASVESPPFACAGNTCDASLQRAALPGYADRGRTKKIRMFARFTSAIATKYAAPSWRTTSARLSASPACHVRATVSADMSTSMNMSTAQGIARCDALCAANERAA